MRVSWLLSCAVLGSLLLGTARAAENPQDCAQAYEKAQEEKTAGRLSGAMANLKTCVAQECPAFIREDCLRWMLQTESALPTVVFSVEEDGNDLTDVQLLCDNKLLTGRLDGKALPIDPGLHEFSFRVPGHRSVERKILAREGEHNRIIKVAFNSSTKLLPPVAPASKSSGTAFQAEPKPQSGRFGPYALAGVGMVGLAGFATFAILGNSQAGDLERTCSPNCQPSQVDSVKTKYHLADASLGMGLVSLGVATYWWVRSHGKDATERGSTTAFVFIPRSAGAVGVLQFFTSY
jgi:hypothetical protein